MNDQSPLLLGVDAGGTKSRALLATAGPGDRYCILGVGEAGPGNPMSHGLPNAARSIVEAMRAAVDGLNRQVEVAVVAAAGAADDTLRLALQKTLAAAGIAKICRVVPDYEPFFSLAKPPVVGVISGTGSVAFSRAGDHDVLRVGGWGYLLGDEGSGYAIGRRALQQTLGEIEADRPRSAVAVACCSTLDADSRAGLLAAVYQAADQRSRIASIARGVIGLAPQDADASALLCEEATSLSKVVGRAVNGAKFAAGGYTLSLGGGVLAGSQFFRNALCDCLASDGLTPARIIVVRDPAIGCVAAAHASVC
ncbi:BadF/BadG/BcrA/BcrD ATPase family protein [Posidoniimonas polymericola]|uniref:BadF/BadG/BcrA/BcrD ATPase family protein n=1 Tax=Posidoniimonas polymericola TaxID=2528002 RepID=UPI0018D28276|nr:BadF/BadG/BcrA/BcrD ATPase family protein [Posidoniimonas polymericola]